MHTKTSLLLPSTGHATPPPKKKKKTTKKKQKNTHTPYDFEWAHGLGAINSSHLYLQFFSMLSDSIFFSILSDSIFLSILSDIHLYHGSPGVA